MDSIPEQGGKVGDVPASLPLLQSPAPTVTHSPLLGTRGTELRDVVQGPGPQRKPFSERTHFSPS